MDEYRKNNLALWNEWTRINAASSMYRLKEFKAGESSLTPLELAEVGDVKRRSLLHLQCHFGMDTLSWARLGARVTGVDFSDEAVNLARSLSSELKIPAEFIQCDLYDLPRHLDRQFDIVYTSFGVLSWLPDLTAWAQLAARYLSPGGFFYIAEFHPFAMVFDDSADEPRLNYSYFNQEVERYPVSGSYADPTAESKVKDEYNWPYTLGGVVTALLQAGLVPEYLHEHPYTVFPQLPYLVKKDRHYWVLPEGTPEFPLMFSIKARKR